MSVDEHPITATPPHLTAEESSRADTYALLAALLAGPPSEALLAGLGDLEITPATASEDKGMQAAWAMLKLSAQRTRVQEAAEEYQDLFVGLGRGELVPYGSWYLTGMLMDKPLMLLRQDLAALGFERQTDVREPEDHVAALCEVMALLIHQETDHLLTQQSRFFLKHSSPWLGHFFKDLSEAQSAHFYKSVGLVGSQFIALEQRAFAMLR